MGPRAGPSSDTTVSTTRWQCLAARSRVASAVLAHLGRARPPRPCSPTSAVLAHLGRARPPRPCSPTSACHDPKTSSVQTEKRLATPRSRCHAEIALPRRDRAATPRSRCHAEIALPRRDRPATPRSRCHAEERPAMPRPARPGCANRTATLTVTAPCRGRPSRS